MKKYIFGVFAVALAVGFSSFKSSNKFAGTAWYLYNGGGQGLASSYVSPSTGSPICNSTADLCEVKFPFSTATPPANPAQSDVNAAQSHISTIVAAGTPNDATVRLHE